MLAEQTLYTLIEKKLVKRMLFKGSLIAGLGAICIVSFGAFSPLRFLNEWGFMIIIMGFALIGWGLIPYRKVSLLSTKPNALKLSHKGLTYTMGSKEMFFIPFNAIKTVWYRPDANHYGIGIELKEKLASKIQVLDPSFRPRSFLKKEAAQSRYHIFLPYFNQQASIELTEILREV